MDIIISGCKEDANIYTNFISTDKNLNVISVTYTEEDTINEFNVKKPDLMILDLTATNINAMHILSKLLSADKKITQKIILITNSSLFNIVDGSKFSDILKKPITREKLLRSIYQIKLNISDEITVQDIKKLFLNLKIDLYSNGVHYLIEAILMAAENHRLLQNLQEIYEKIAYKHNISAEKVKWSIRSTIDTINKYADNTVFNTIFKYYDETRALTPKYFIKQVLYYFDIDADE